MPPCKVSFAGEIERLTPLFVEGELDSSSPCIRALEQEANTAFIGLGEGKTEAIETALAYLAIRRKVFRSGYSCTRLARRLKRAALTEIQKGILRTLLLDRLTWPWGHTPDLWRCYPAVRTPEGDLALKALAKSSKSWIARRAQGILKSLGRA